MLKYIKRFFRKAINSVSGKVVNTNKNKYFDPPSIWIDHIFNEAKKNIVQVGSNDGVSGDPLYNLINKNVAWEALFIEPVPYLFEKLKENYGNHPRFRFENVAINDGTYQTFYSVKNSAKLEIPNLPMWYDQLGSFNRKNITKHLNGVLEPYIEEINIKGATLPYILNSNKIKSLDLLHIDAEGYDWVVLSQLDLKSFKPKIILFEHKHLSSLEKEQSLGFLKRYNYSVFKLGWDFICIKTNATNLKLIKKLKGVKVK